MSDNIIIKGFKLIESTFKVASEVFQVNEPLISEEFQKYLNNGGSLDDVLNGKSDKYEVN